LVDAAPATGLVDAAAADGVAATRVARRAAGVGEATGRGVKKEDRRVAVAGATTREDGNAAGVDTNAMAMRPVDHRQDQEGEGTKRGRGTGTEG